MSVFYERSKCGATLKNCENFSSYASLFEAKNPHNTSCISNSLKANFLMKEEEEK